MTILLMLAVIQLILAQDDQGFNVTECELTKGCFRPNDCDPMTTCDFAVSYRPINDSKNIGWIEFELVGRLEAWNFTSQTGGYVAVGFSQDQKMANTPVTECSSLYGERLYGRLSYNGDANDGHMNERIPANDPAIPPAKLDAMIEVFTNREVDRRIYCRLRQKIFPDFNSSKVAPLDGEFFLLLAIGRTNADCSALSQHTARAFSETKISLLSVKSTTQTSRQVYGIMTTMIMLAFYVIDY